MEIAKHLHNTQSSYIREILQAATDPNLLSLAGGLPATQSLPVKLLREALAGGSDDTVLQYGETQGYPPLLKYLKKIYQVPDQQGLLISNGSQQGLDLIARAFINPGDSVAMEAPSYLGALQVFNLAQAQIRTIDQNREGPDTDEVERLFSSEKIKCFYAVPDFHNPTGLCWSLSTRLKVAALCQQYNVTFIEDAPYRALRFSGSELPMVSSFCPDHAIILRSYSKISAPGMRLGSVQSPLPWLRAMTTIKQASDLHTNLPMQEALLALLDHSQFNNHLETVRHHYAQQYNTMKQALEILGPGYDYDPICGGMFVWLKLPVSNGKSIDLMSLAQEALARGVAVVPGDVFYTGNTKRNPALRLNFTYVPASQLGTAVKRLKLAIDTVMKS